MAIQPVDTNKCVGCGRCVFVCPCDVIRMDQTAKKAVAKFPQDCMCCAECEDECPVGAIFVSPEKHDRLMVSWR